MSSVIDAPNPRRPSAFQRWLAAAALGMFVGVPATMLTVYLLPASLPAGVGWLFLLTPFACVLAAYGLLERAWPDRVTLALEEGRITGAIKGGTLPAGRGVVRVTGDYGRTPRGIRYDVYTIRYLPGDAQTASLTLHAGCTDPIRVRDFAEALCQLGGYTLRWQPPGSLEWEERGPEELDRPLGVRLAASGATLAPPAAPRTRVQWLEDGTLRVRTGGPRAITVARITLWFVLVAGATALLELRSPGSWAAVFTGAIALILAMLLLLSAADVVIRHEYHLGPDGARCRTRLLGVPCRTWSVPASAIGSLYVRDDDGTIVLAGTGFRRRVRLGVLPRGDEFRWVAALAEAAIAGRPLRGGT